MSKHEGRMIMDVVTDAVDALGAIRRWCEEKVETNSVSPSERQRFFHYEASASARIALLECDLSSYKLKIDELRKENDGLRTKLRQHERSYERFLRALEEARNER